MSMPTDPSSKGIKRLAANSALVLSFIVAFEILIMVSPFAAFFYSVFNPILLSLNQSSTTRWLAAFFLPHMVVPPNEVLVGIRILGSVLFVAGMAVFLVCAGQIYLGKMFKAGTATRGVYQLVRHPQYVGLAAAALGLAIMWPRFLTLVLFAVMLLLYYILAKDEERRMTNRFGEHYTSYKHRTGMFLPRPIERVFLKGEGTQAKPGFVKIAIVFVAICLIIVGKGFLLRAYTIHALPLQEFDGVDVLSISVEDTTNVADLVPAVLADSAVASRLKTLPADHRHRLLAYCLPIDYVMQGMIADTGEEWKLFQHHKTWGLITEYILHPFAHLTGGHAQHMMGGMKHGPEMYALPAMKRRLIFVEVASDNNELNSPTDDFGINALRTPLFFVDVHLHTGEILQVRDTPTGSGWGAVPTPTF